MPSWRRCASDPDGTAGRAAAGVATEAPPDLSATCALERSDAGEPPAFRLALLVSNGGADAILDVTPGMLDATNTGTAVLFVRIFPSPLPVLAPGGDAAFVWSGQSFGDGSIEVRTSLTARRADG